MDSTLIFVFAIILIAALVAVSLIARGGQAVRQLSVDKYRRAWFEIENKLNKNDVNSCHIAIIEADKLLDTALRERGVGGETMGDRLKAARDTFSNNGAIWTAHKTRNRLVHEPGVNVGYEETRRALSAVKQALKDIGAI